MPIENIFATPIYYTVIDDRENIQNEISDCINQLEFKINSSWGNTNYLSDISFRENVIVDRKLNFLKQEIEKHVFEYCRQIKSSIKNFKIYGSWISLFNKGNYGHIHNHGYSDISGVYYFQTTEDDGKLFFTSPVPTLESSYVYQQLGNRWEHKPMEGKLLLFPGWINHGIETNQTDNSRISLSFNIMFDKN